MIHIYNRHCNFSPIGANKERPVKGFDRKKCFYSLYEYVADDGDFNIVFDGKIDGSHFTYDLPSTYDVKLRTIAAGSGVKSYIQTIDMALSDGHKDDDILYFVEDDYLHNWNSNEVLLEAFDLFKDHKAYVTLYDHGDKYSDMYGGLFSQIFATKSCHWRNTPSTTDTFACTVKTLKADYSFHKRWSEWGGNYSQDHQRSLDISNPSNRSFFISSIPGYSTHVDKWLSPCVNWDQVNEDL